MTRQCSTGHLRDTPYVPNDLTDSSTGRVRETIVPPSYETDSSTGRVRETPRPTNDQTHSTTGRVRETLHPTNHGRDPSTGCVRESPHSPNEKTDFSIGRVADTPHTTNDQADSRLGRVRETPKPTIRFKHGEHKSLPSRRPAHQEPDSTVANENARTDHQHSQKSSSARNRPSPSFYREGENILENFSQQVTGRKNLVFILVHRKCN